jgi:hypothetical protein
MQPQLRTRDSVAMQDAIPQSEQKKEDAAERQRPVGAGQIDQVADAVHGAVDELEHQMQVAASRLQEGAGALRGRSLRDLMDTFNDLGRKEPLAVFGGAVLAGFAISRFLKSSADNSAGGNRQ